MGKKNGHGTEFGWEKEVKVYVGQFKEGDRCGQGMEFDPVTGNKIYQGAYKDGTRHGDGIKYEYNGNTLASRIEVTYENGILVKRNHISSSDGLDNCFLFLFYQKKNKNSKKKTQKNKI